MIAANLSVIYESVKHVDDTLVHFENKVCCGTNYKVMCGEFIKGILNHKTNKEDLTMLHSVACEQTLPEHFGSGVKRKESLQSRLRSLNSAELSVLANQRGAEMSIKCT